MVTLGEFVNKNFQLVIKMADKVALPEFTMFSKTPVYAEAGGLQFGLRVPDLASSADRILRVTGPLEDRLDLVAAAYQGNPQLWWVAADLTGLTDPLAEVTTGLNVRFSPNAGKQTT